jgi:hypothetical protein
MTPRAYIFKGASCARGAGAYGSAVSIWQKPKIPSADEVPTRTRVEVRPSYMHASCFLDDVFKALQLALQLYLICRRERQA